MRTLSKKTVGTMLAIIMMLMGTLSQLRILESMEVEHIPLLCSLHHRIQ